MKFLLSLLCLLLMTGCSKPDDRSSVDRRTKPVQFHRYLVTFVAVKAPNELLQPYMTNSVGPNSIKERYRIANYLLAHTNDFSIIAPGGNFVPLVTTGHGTGGRFVLDSKQEEEDLERTGIKVRGLEVNVEVKDEDDHGSVWYEGMADYSVDVSPTGEYGGGIPFPGGLLPVAQADLQPLYAGKNFTLCALVKLNRTN